jgi:hypothetical protein
MRNSRACTLLIPAFVCVALGFVAAYIQINTFYTCFDGCSSGFYYSIFEMEGHLLEWPPQPVGFAFMVILFPFIYGPFNYLAYLSTTLFHGLIFFGIWQSLKNLYVRRKAIKASIMKVLQYTD